VVLEREIGVYSCAVYNGVNAAKVGDGKGDYFSGRGDDVMDLGLPNKYDYFVVNINIVMNIAEVKMSRYLITIVIFGVIKVLLHN
jgi:hypothetical protein